MADDAEKPIRDYRETVFLPETPFPMRAGLPQKEPQILSAWEEANLYHAIRAERQRVRNSAVGTSSLRRPLPRNSSSIFHSIGRPWQSQPGT